VEVHLARVTAGLVIRRASGRAGSVRLAALACAFASIPACGADETLQGGAAAGDIAAEDGAPGETKAPFDASFDVPDISVAEAVVDAHADAQPEAQPDSIDAADAASPDVVTIPCVPSDCDDAQPCTSDACTPAGCVHAPNLLPCSDGDACTDGDQCQGGACTPGKPHLCSDANPCTDDGCDGKLGCTFVPNTAPCSDSNVCTGGDACQGGVCLPGSASACDDGNLCTGDSCDTNLGCQHTPNAAGCDDGNACTTGDTCTAGACVPGKSLACNDGNPCTADSCDPAAGCKSVPEAQPCDDGNACSVGDKCAGGVCQPGAPLDCDDGNGCTSDVCQPSGTCAHAPNVAACTDGNVCTVGDACSGGTCQGGKAMVCDDGNPCTQDACAVGLGCTATATSAPCSDGNVCTKTDLCAGGVCVPGPWLDCDDGNGCTSDACDAKAGCTHTANTAGCSDGDACTVGEACQAGTCQGGAPQPCNDGNPCTDDSCQGGSCKASPNKGPCSDGNACTQGDHCESGACAVLPVVCNDGNACTNDACNPAAGCQFSANTVGCDDGNACTVGDACAGSACKPGGVIGCSDGNPCTDDACSPKVGCAFAFNTAQCADGNACTQSDACKLGTCQGIPAKCDDANPCTSDLCDAIKGCIGLPLAGTCSDGNACTISDACDQGSCVGQPKVCDDGLACTIDSCVAPKGCTAKVAVDGSACGPGVCQSGACTIGNENVPAASCKQAKDILGNPKSGTYWLDPDGKQGPDEPFQAYCEMEADGGGWTLVLKVDGVQQNFVQGSPLWTNGSPYNGLAFGYDDQEARLLGYASVPFQAVRVGLKVGTVANFIVVPTTSSSLAYLFSLGKPIATTVGRDKWKSLLADASLQKNCNQEGFNTLRCRIGITANQEADCNSPDSWLGIGCAGGFAAGNWADPNWEPDNFGKATKAFGYVFVR
jgi:hypothetical protein